MSKLIIEVCKVEKVEKHPNADKLSIVTIKGWNCIVGLDQYKAGDLCIYCPPDSIIPNNLIEKHNLEFLKKNGKVGIVKLRKIVSQGLILDINDLPANVKAKEGLNVADILGIKKWEPPEPGFQAGKKKEKISDYFMMLVRREITVRRFASKTVGIIKDRIFKKKRKLNPLFDVYTDIENIKNYQNVFQDGEDVIITEKIHGTNVRYGHLPKVKKSLFNKDSHEFCYGSHKVQICGNRGKNCFYGEDVYGKIAEKLQIADKLPENIVLYGEIFGKGIQDLTYGLSDIGIRFFDAKDTKTRKYLDFNDFYKLINELDPVGDTFIAVPLLYRGSYSTEIVKKCTEGKSVIYSDQMREGCVIKPIKEQYVHMGRKILKSINEEYLLRKNGTEFK